MAEKATNVKKAHKAGLNIADFSSSVHFSRRVNNEYDCVHHREGG